MKNRFDIIKEDLTLQYNPNVEWFSLSGADFIASGADMGAEAAKDSGTLDIVQMGTEAALTILSGFLNKAPNEFKGKVKAACGGKPLVGAAAKERWRKCAQKILQPIMPPPPAEKKMDTATIAVIGGSALAVGGLIAFAIWKSKKNAAAA